MVFHSILQKKAIQDLQSKTDAALWEQAVKTYFPEGIFSLDNSKIESKE
jgi:hypothetical protein